MAMTEDLSVFFDTDDHAVMAVYTPKGYPHPSSKSRNVDGIFDNTYYDDAGIESSVPVFTCIATDVSDVLQGANLTVKNVDYQVINARPDGTGITELQLQFV